MLFNPPHSFENIIKTQDFGSEFFVCLYLVERKKVCTFAPMKEGWRNEVKPSMKRRMTAIDYSQPGIYMITIATEGRKPLFGKVVADAQSVARMEKSQLGEWVNREVEQIPRHYPQIRILSKQVMPDHLHFILYVTEALPVHLGRVINGFKSGCNKGYKTLLPQSGEPRDTQLTPKSSTQAPKSSLQAALQSGLQAGGEAGGSLGGRVSCSASERQEQPRDRAHGLLFETGYNDRVLYGKGQLQKMIDYIHDNPRRLLLRRQNPEWLHPKFHIQIGTQEYATIGNLQLLKRPCLAVRVSRRCSEEQIQTHINTYLSAAQKGSVLVSPAISPGEKRVMRAAFDAKLPVIVIVENGFTDYTKPSGEQFDACAEGRLLLLAPWEHHTDNRKLTQQQCQAMNLMAIEIQQGTHM